MTKVISLSEKAYQTFKSMKKPSESFSDVILRVAEQEQKKSILDLAGIWIGDDIEAAFSTVSEEREHLQSREIEI
jgi:predicted CopG family antitoxin